MNLYKIILLFATLQFWTFGHSQQSSTQVSGKVLSKRNNQPLQSVTIYAKQSSTTAITNNKGEFSISIYSLPDTLILTHVGYDKFEERITKDVILPIQIFLEESTPELSEVIVNTGMQKLPKERSTGSFTVISNKLYNEQIGTNVLERLKYITNGVTVFSGRVGGTVSDQLIIRGISTMTMSIQKPLIILDDFEYYGNLENINPNEVENVTFLKDAAASSIWGAKAANGVIVISTKKGIQNRKPTIEISSNISFISEPDLFSLRSISSGDLVEAERYLFDRGYRFSDTASVRRPAFSPLYEILFAARNGTITQQDAERQISLLSQSDVRDDFKKYMYQQAVNKQNYINVRGGGANNTWLFSFGFDDNVNELAVKYKRYTSRLENSFTLTKRITASTGISYTQSKFISGKTAYGSINSLPVYSSLDTDNGSSQPIYIKYRQTYLDTAGGGKLLNWKYYPLEEYQHIKEVSDLQYINVNLAISYKISPFLNLNVKYRYQREQVSGSTLSDENSFFTRDLINNYSQLNRNTGVVSYNVPLGDILDLSNSNRNTHNVRSTLNFDRALGSGKLIALIGSEISESVSESQSNRVYGYNSSVLTQKNVDYANTYPLFISGSAFIPNGNGLGKNTQRMVSFFFNSAYEYRGKYTFSISARRDASNLFGFAINDKWKPLWSSGISWDIFKEKFFTSKKITQLKLRATYGSQGNIDPAKVAVTTFRYNGTNPFTQNQYSTINNFINPDLKWEQVNMMNIAIDYSFGKKISGSIEFYKKTIKDLYAPTPIDPTAGVGAVITKNVGTMKGSGVDLEITSKNIDKAIKWTTHFYLNYYKDKVTKYFDTNQISKNLLVQSRIIGLEGYSPFAMWAYRWAGLDPANGNPMGYLNGAVSNNWAAITGNQASLTDDMRYIGTQFPLFSGSMGNEISYKAFTISARVSFKFNYFFKRESINYSTLMQTLSGHSDYHNRWQVSGDEKNTSIPSFSYPLNSARDAFYNSSEILVEKGDHIRLQYVNISYSFNPQKTPFKKLQLYGVVNNLGIIWRANKQNLDPEFPGIRLSISYSIGTNISF